MVFGIVDRPLWGNEPAHGYVESKSALEAGFHWAELLGLK